MSINKSGQDRNMKDNGIKAIDITVEELELLLKRIREKQLTNNDYLLLECIINGYSLINQLLNDSKTSIKRLKRLFFQKSEKSKNILNKNASESENKSANDNVQYPGIVAEDELNSKEKQSNETGGKKRKGHGRNGADSYEGAETITVKVDGLKAGDVCPECNRSKLYKFRDCKVLRIKGIPPIKTCVYKLEVLRCSGCQEIFKAELPKDAGNIKYDEESLSILAIFKYGSGMPFNRLEWIQKNLGVPLPSSTQWSLLKDFSMKIYPVYYQLLRIAAQGEILHNDDTNIKILSLMKENKEMENQKIKSKRKGIFTTGILSKIKNHQIALYFSGRNHAGENLQKLLKNRILSLPPPIQMCDAASRNEIEEPPVLLANCLSHARRNFVDLLETFPVESEHVIKIFGKIYGFEKEAKINEMTPSQRLEYHKKKSKPLMDDLKLWFENKFKKKEVEPNSNLGKAIQYMFNHWEKLTLFLRVEKAPLDNNPCERNLKVPILNRKNALFYKTLNGSATGDIFMSIIQTCKLEGVNIFNYLTDIQKHENDMFDNFEAWLPWNYKKKSVSLKKIS